MICFELIQASNGKNRIIPSNILSFPPPSTPAKSISVVAAALRVNPSPLRYLWGFCPDSRHAALFPGRIIPFKLHSYLRPVLFPSRLPGGYQTIHLEDFMSPWSAIKGSVRKCVLETWVVPVRCRKKVCRFGVGSCRNVHNFLDIGRLKAKDLHVHLWTSSQKKGLSHPAPCFVSSHFDISDADTATKMCLQGNIWTSSFPCARPLTKHWLRAASPIISVFFDAVRLKGGGRGDKD